MTNDFHEDDYFYVNNQNGTFTEQGKKYFKHFSRLPWGATSPISITMDMRYHELDMYPADEFVEKTSQGDAMGCVSI